MANNIQDLMKISDLLGLNRVDRRVSQFLSELGYKPTVTIDNSDGANEEYIEFKEYGYCLYFDGGVLVSIFLHSGEVNSEYSKFELDLPRLLNFEMHKKDVLNLLGIPKSEGGGNDPFWGEIPSWIKYELDNYFVHIEFNKGLNSIRLITLSL